MTPIFDRGMLLCVCLWTALINVLPHNGTWEIWKVAIKIRECSVGVWETKHPYTHKISFTHELSPPPPLMQHIYQTIEIVCEHIAQWVSEDRDGKVSSNFYDNNTQSFHWKLSLESRALFQRTGYRRRARGRHGEWLVFPPSLPRSQCSHPSPSFLAPCHTDEKIPDLVCCLVSLVSVSLLLLPARLPSCLGRVAAPSNFFILDMCLCIFFFFRFNSLKIEGGPPLTDCEKSKSLQTLAHNHNGGCDHHRLTHCSCSCFIKGQNRMLTRHLLLHVLPSSKW